MTDHLTDPHGLTGPVVLELPVPCGTDAFRALLRSAYRRSARALREILGHPDAAADLERLADELRSPPVDPQPASPDFEDDDPDPDTDDTVVMDVSIPAWVALTRG
jgi:hypothetical protein